MWRLVDPQVRSGWHTVIFAIATIVLLWDVSRIIELVHASVNAESEIARFCLCILALAVIGRNFVIKLGPAMLDASGNAPGDKSND